ncbi:MAG TPA: prepilin-type N-terminal cleavage/methylation domain-containing protein [Clostridia bacterium]|nr:prepilin-type N-terminal cleavage/methylation domain-containing protein [Clostridia bacterium]
MRKARKNQKGFTLVELMVVVVIIGVLVAIAVPVYSNMTLRAKERACDANVRTIQSAVNAFYAEKNEYPENLKDLEDYLGQDELQCPVNGEPYQIDENNGTVYCEHKRENSSTQDD